MNLGVRELRRSPGRFGVVTAALSLLVVLLVVLGAIVDGLTLDASGLLRAQRGDVVVYADDARASFVRSRLGDEQRRVIAEVDGVEAVGGIGVALLAAAVPGESELADVAVVGYELPARGVPAPPAPGQAWADSSLRADGVAEGDALAVGPTGEVITVVGFVEDTSYLAQGSLWVEAETWRAVQSAARPDEAVTGDAFQVFTVEAAPDVEAAELADAISAATDGTTDVLTRDEAIGSIPGSAEQSSVFRLLIATGLAAAGLVTTLFFALLVIERTALFATLKAVGAPSRRLFTGVLLQALLVTAVAIAIGGVASAGLVAVIPDAVPFRVEADRLVVSATLLLLTAAAGATLSLRRITRIDPASAIGGGT